MLSKEDIAVRECRTTEDSVDTWEDVKQKWTLPEPRAQGKKFQTRNRTPLWLEIYTEKDQKATEDNISSNISFPRRASKWLNLQYLPKDLIGFKSPSYHALDLKHQQFTFKK